MIAQQFTPRAVNDAPTEDRRTTRDDRLTMALERYAAAIDASHPLSKDELLTEFADVADDLRGCLDSLDFIREVAPQLGDAHVGESLRDSHSAVGEPLRDSQVLHGSPDPAPAGHSRATLGDFRIVRELGRGGMGVVYEAEQLSLGRRVALKVLPFAAMLDRQQLNRFKNEARAAATLDHANIVAIYSVGVERGVHYYAMQLIEGQSLAQVVELFRRDRPQGASPPLNRNRTAAVERCRAVEQQGAGSEHSQSAGDCPNFAQQNGTVPLSQSAIRNPGYPLGAAIPSPKPPAPSPSFDTAPVARLSTLPDFNSRDYYRTIAQLGIQAAEALDHAHQNGILHRDIKPANLLVESNFNTPSSLRGGPGRGCDDALKLWITDFGLARIEQDAGMTMTGDLLGTLRYMSPEQALAKRVIVDHRSDIYSLGVTLYELLTLEPAFPADDRQELLRQIAFDEPRRPRQINAHIPQDLETIVLKAIEKNPAQRYATAHDLAEDLRRFLDHQPIKAKPPTWRNRIAKWSRRHPVGIRAAILTCLASTVVLAASIGWAIRDRVAQRALTNTTTGLSFVGTDLRRLGRLDDAITAYNEAILIDPSNAVSYYNLGMALFEKGQPSQAVENLQQTIRLNPNFAEAYLYLGFVQRNMGLFEEAIDNIQEAIRLKPNLAQAHNQLASAYKENGQPDEAVAEYRKAIKVAPDDYIAYGNLGNIFHQKRDFDEAIPMMRSAIRLNPTDFRCYLNLGSLYLTKGEIDEGVRFLRYGIPLTPDPSSHYSNNFMYELLEHYLRVQDGFEAVSAFYEELLHLQPENPVFHLRLAGALRWQGNTDQAISAETKAIRLHQKGLGSAQLFGDYFAGTGRYSDAVKYFLQAHKAKPDDSKIACVTAYLLAFSGDREAHRALCEEMLERFAATRDMTAIWRTWSACMIFDPPVGDLTHLLQLADLVAQNDSKPTEAARKRARAAYRAGDLQGALNWTRKAREADKPKTVTEPYPDNMDGFRGDVHELLFEAMALKRLGKAEEAESRFADAIQAMQKAFPEDDTPSRKFRVWDDYVGSEILRREAEALIKPSADSKEEVKTEQPTSEDATISE